MIAQLRDTGLVRRVSELLIVTCALTYPVLAQSEKTTRPVAPATETSLFGQWWTPGFGSRVEISRCDDGICGHLVWLWDPRYAKIGQTILSGFQAAEPGHWDSGTAFNPVDENTYRATLTLMPAQRLKVRGCVLFFCREQVWIRVGTLDTVPRRAQIR